MKFVKKVKKLKRYPCVIYNCKTEVNTHELMLELGSADNISPFMNVDDENISFTIFKKDGENPFKKEDTIFRFKVDNKLIETKPTSGSTFGDNVTFSISTLLISGEKYKEIVEAFKEGSELKILIMNSSGVKMLFDTLMMQ